MVKGYINDTDIFFILYGVDSLLYQHDDGCLKEKQMARGPTGSLL